MMMNCRQATRLLSDAQEHKLPIMDRAALKMHVVMCSGCRNFAKQMGVLREIAHAYAKGTEAEPGSDRQSGDDERPN